MERKEIHYWNFLKTLAICQVVFCHVPFLNASWQDNFFQLLTFMSVPLFYMVNGAALFQGKLDLKKHMGKIWHLFWVTRVWRLVYLLFALGFHYVEWSSIPKAKICSYFLGDSIKGVPSGPLWFIRALIACYLIFPVLKIAFDSAKTRVWLWVLVSAMVVLFCCRQEVLLLLEGLLHRGMIGKKTAVSFNFMTQYNPIGEWAVLYFLLGGLLHQRYFVEKKKDAFVSTPVCLIGVILGTCWFFGMKGLILGFSGTELNHYSKYGVDGVYQSFALLCMVVGTFQLAMRMPFTWKTSNRIYKTVGRMTLPIFYTHYMLGYLLKMYVPYFAAHPGVLTNLVKVMILVALGLLIGTVGKKIPGVRKLVM